MGGLLEFAEQIAGSASGAVAQLVARFVRIEEVRGSIPLSSTITRALPPFGGGALRVSVLFCVFALFRVFSALCVSQCFFVSPCSSVRGSRCAPERRVAVCRVTFGMEKLLNGNWARSTDHRSSRGQLIGVKNMQARQRISDALASATVLATIAATMLLVNVL